MPGFPILHPPSHLVEKLISKVDSKSNFRLRQTCRTVNNLILRTPNISARVDGQFFIDYYDDSVKLSHCVGSEQETLDITAYYGTRLGLLSFEIRSYDDTSFTSFCETLKNCRITCDKLEMGDIELFFSSTNQCVSLVKLLKPVKLELGCFMLKDFRFEKLFSCKTVKHFVTRLDEEDALPSITKLFSFPSLSTLEIEVFKPASHFALLQEVVQLFVSLPVPNFKKFHFYISYKGPTSQTKLEQQLPEMQWTVMNSRNSEEKFSAIMAVPSHFPRGSSCKMVVGERRDPCMENYRIYNGFWGTYNIYYDASDRQEA